MSTWAADGGVSRAPSRLDGSCQAAPWGWSTLDVRQG